MDTKTVAIKRAEQWGVVYSYGSVLAVFENEQDALLEANSFGGAAVRIVQEVRRMSDGDNPEAALQALAPPAIA